MAWGRPHLMGMNMFKKIGIIAVLGSLAACSGGFVMAGTPAGIASYDTMTNGYVTNGKASPDVTTAHWNYRRLREREETKRNGSSFLDGLFVRREVAAGEVSRERDN